MENTFIPYEKALSILEEHKGEFPIESRNLEDCIGAYLAEDLLADRDFPPFDRVTMDGIAIVYGTFENGKRTFNIESVAAAGTPQLTLKDTQNCIEVMTGAIMPNGVDTVIRYEDLTIENNQATINLDSLNHKQNVHFKGIDIAQGTKIVNQGKKLSSAEINIAAAVGKASLLVKKMPKVVIFSTGDELVPVHQTPKLHQIRRSNIYGIQATLKEWGVLAKLEHLADNKEEMLATISVLLKEYDLFIFTGGVSKGKFDYLPDVLEELKVKKHFHKIQQRPGKPFWFGSNTEGKKIFALPGNPVSSFVCVYMYLQFWLQKSLGIEQEVLHVKLKNDVEFKPDLVYFLEATLESNPDGTLSAEAIKGNGSGDFANLVKTDGFLILPQNKSQFFANEVYPFVPYRTKW
ncbi:molybdopterin molybdotransferase MoeA [Maribacter arcticus]|uniref:Molybdopterin molybdenumtransferase n=1 Tax=Maribacter arcticus TaxID=561365 RepID=A0A1T5BLJ6_9FLAO|nr:molybdopterin molybdotransferase MoeA [Maribacter arcticus]SKB48164.1 molybdopterin molybdotransferase [Maribacter arcticus]|tara:strand:- start:305 stop:1519 length:1215 start_codon:yes stop_codon:yes gene_type:complete